MRLVLSQVIPVWLVFYTKIRVSPYTRVLAWYSPNTSIFSMPLFRYSFSCHSLTTLQGGAIITSLMRMAQIKIDRVHVHFSPVVRGNGGFDVRVPKVPLPPPTQYCADNTCWLGEILMHFGSCTCWVKCLA